MRLREVAAASGYAAPIIKLLRQRNMLPWNELEPRTGAVGWLTYSADQCQRLCVLKLLVACGMRTEAASRLVRDNLEGAISVAAVLARVQGRSSDLASLSRHGLS